MKAKYNLQNIDIPFGWTVTKNDFYDIDPFDENISDDDKHDYIFSQEDLLHLTKSNYHLDLGWYGYNDLDIDTTGYRIYLFKGVNWNIAEFFIEFHSKSKAIIAAKIAELIKIVDRGEFDK